MTLSDTKISRLAVALYLGEGWNLPVATSPVSSALMSATVADLDRLFFVLKKAERVTKILDQGNSPKQ